MKTLRTILALGQSFLLVALLFTSALAEPQKPNHAAGRVEGGAGAAEKSNSHPCPPVMASDISPATAQTLCNITLILTGTTAKFLAGFMVILTCIGRALKTMTWKAACVLAAVVILSISGATLAFPFINDRYICSVSCFAQ